MHPFGKALLTLILNSVPQLLGFIAGFGVAIFAEPIRQWIYRPKVKLLFGSSQDFITSTEEFDGESKYHAKYVRLMTTNHSSHLARGCRVFLTLIERETETGRFERTQYCDSIQLAWSVRGTQTFSSIDLPNGLTQFVDVISTREHATAFQVHVQSLPFRYESILSQPNTYRFTCRVVGDDIEPDELRLVFRWDGEWNLFSVAPVV